jgi:hypothetical protein
MSVLTSSPPGTNRDSATSFGGVPSLHGMDDSIVVQYRTKPETADENQRLVEAVYAELALRQPEGLRYSTYRLSDGVTFVHVAQGPGRAALGEVAAFQEFQRDIASRVEDGPNATPATLIGSYQS